MVMLLKMEMEDYEDIIILMTTTWIGLFLIQVLGAFLDAHHGVQIGVNISNFVKTTLLKERWHSLIQL